MYENEVITEKETYALVNKRGNIIKNVEYKDVEDEINKLNARKISYYHVDRVVKITEIKEIIPMTVNKFKDEHFMGTEAWVCEVQKNLYVDDFYEDGKYNAIEIHGIGDVSDRQMAEMVMQRLELEHDEKMGESFVFDEEFNCIIPTGNNYYEEFRKGYYDLFVAEKDEKKRKSLFGEFKGWRGMPGYRVERKRIDTTIENLFRDGIVSMPDNVAYNGWLMGRLDREHPDLKYDVIKENGIYKLKIVCQNQK